MRTIDLQVASIDVVARADQPIPEGRGEWDSLPGRLVRVTLQTDENVRAAQNKWHLNVWFDAWFCPNRERALSYLPIVYDAAGVVDTGPRQSDSDSNDVWVYVAETAAARSDAHTNKIRPRYALREARDDVCVEVRGRDMMLRGFTSNIVRIPAKRLADSLK